MVNFSGPIREDADGVEITWEMLEAGAEILIINANLLFRGDAGVRDLAERVFRAMAAAAPPEKLSIDTLPVDAEIHVDEAVICGDVVSGLDAFAEASIDEAEPGGDRCVAYWINNQGQLVEDDGTAEDIGLLRPGDLADMGFGVPPFMVATTAGGAEEPPCDCPVCTAGRNLLEAAQPFIDLNGAGLRVVWRDAFPGDGRLI